MKPMKMKLLFYVIIVLVVGVVGCGRSKFTEPTVVSNPAPPVRLGEFANVEVLPIEVMPEVKKEEDADECYKVAGRIDELFAAKIQYLLDKWNTDSENPPTRDTLVIRPYITQLKWVTRGERVWAGSMYGNSAIVIEMELVDKSDGTVFAKPLLLSRAHAMGGAWGTQDDAMLTSMAEKMASYIAQNYGAAVGGPTGVESK